MTASIALFPLNIVLFPDGPLPLRIFETRYVDMVGRCMRKGDGFGVALIREGNEVGPAETYDVGTIARIMDFNQLPDGLLGLSCVGLQRFRIMRRSLAPDGLNLAEIEPLAPEPTLPFHRATHDCRSCWITCCRSSARCIRASRCGLTMRRGSAIVSRKFSRSRRTRSKAFSKSTIPFSGSTCWRPWSG